MHRICRFNLDEAYIGYVDKRMVAIMKEKVAEYNKQQAEDPKDPSLSPELRSSAQVLPPPQYRDVQRVASL